MNDWRAQPSWQTLVARDRLNRAIRAFFCRRDVVEISTPVLGLRGSPDCHLQSLEVYTQQDRYFLQTSPEFAMKRVLATYGRSIYQICPAFRQADLGRLHNPEFSILEWYRPEFGLGELMDDEMARSDCLDYLFTECIVAGFSGLTWVVDFPVCQAALAEIDDAGQTASRFELYAQGIELANGYQELTDAIAMQERFNQWNQYRLNRDLPVMAIDQRLLSAISNLPRTAGVAMGLDRLMMAWLDEDNIGKVMPFVWSAS